MNQWRRRWLMVGAVALLVSAAWIASASVLGTDQLRAQDTGTRTVTEVLEGIGATVEPRLEARARDRVSYPNRADMAHRAVPREEMGGDIFVHGGEYSAGCLAVGDPAIEELFVLAARVPAPERRILIVPTDFRLRSDAATSPEPWVRDLYARLAQALSAFPRPP
jgi:hypothetical protein